jgi:hypothetical protein
MIGYENTAKEIETIYREHYILISAKLGFVLDDLKHDLHVFITHELKKVDSINLRFF